jgi:diguanylate cyclase (GGDEF)-like protein
VTLRTRLTATLLAVAVGPLLVGAVAVGAAVRSISQDQAERQLDLAAGAARGAVGSLCQQLRAAAEAVARQPAERRASAARALAGRDPVTAVRIVGPDGAPELTTPGAPPAPWAGCDQPPRTTATRYGALVAQAPLPDRAGEVWAAGRIDQALVERLARAIGAAVTVADPTGPAHSTSEAPGSVAEAARGLPAGAVGRDSAGRLVRRVDPAAGQPLRLVLSVPAPDLRGLYALLAGLVAVAGGLAAAAAWRLARSTAWPLDELAHAADRVADGDLSVRVPVRTGDELGRLAATFNRMAQRTGSYVQALTVSRDQLRRHLGVLGDTLSSTHDLDRILRVTLRTALAATCARAGAVLLLDQERGVLIGHATQGGGARSSGAAGGAAGAAPGGAAGGGEPGTGKGSGEEIPVTVPLGDGLLGSVAATGEARRGRITPEGPALHPAEPACRTYVVVPISAPGGVAAHAAPWPAPPAVRGVLALYDRLGGGEFADDFDDPDLVTLRTFAGQAGVAVDNVRTHQEAQRLSVTDPLTGLWNYRSLQESLRREVERASRFHHPLAVLTLDLDRFKTVNDGYGHPAGDAVLTEFAGRIRSEIREVDLAFRHGGEEFVVLLPETDTRGAMVLAQRLGAAVRDQPIVITPRGGAAALAGPAAGQLPIRVTTSIGVAVYPEHGLTPNALLDAADDALYAAKAAGRDTYRVATAGPPPVAAAELPVRNGARVPDGDLPHAGGAARPGSVHPAGGGAPPRQSRGR